VRPADRHTVTGEADCHKEGQLRQLTALLKDTFKIKRDQILNVISGQEEVKHFAKLIILWAWGGVVVVALRY
jgi:hypothetical protein